MERADGGTIELVGFADKRLRVRLRLPFGTFLAPSLVMVWAWAGLQP